MSMLRSSAGRSLLASKRCSTATVEASTTSPRSGHASPLIPQAAPRPFRSKHQSGGRVHTVDHRRRDQDRRATFFCGLVDDVHSTLLQGGGMIGIDLGGLDTFPRYLSFGRPENDAGLFLP